MASIDIKMYSVCGLTPKSNKSIIGEYLLQKNELSVGEKREKT